MRHKIGLLRLAAAHFLKHHVIKTRTRAKYLASRARRFIPQETTTAPNRMGGCVGPKTGPDALERKEFETRIVQPVA